MKYATAAAFRTALEQRLLTTSLQTGVPLGRIATALERSTPAERQPATIVWPMLPQPTNQVGPGNCMR